MQVMGSHENAIFRKCSQVFDCNSAFDSAQTSNLYILLIGSHICCKSCSKLLSGGPHVCLMGSFSDILDSWSNSTYYYFELLKEPSNHKPL